MQQLATNKKSSKEVLYKEKRFSGCESLNSTQGMQKLYTHKTDKSKTYKLNHKHTIILDMLSTSGQESYKRYETNRVIEKRKNLLFAYMKDRHSFSA